jgi:citrate lyase beta subunit
MDRQPVHTVYGGAHLFKAGTVRNLGSLALRSLQTYGADPVEFAAALGIPAQLAESVHARVIAKLEREPVEDYRIDFEDGYGIRSEAEELGDAVRCARDATDLPPFFGIRIKPIANPPGARTLHAFLGSTPRLPANFVVTLPKVTSPEDVSSLIDLLASYESSRGLTVGTIRIELMIETPQAIYTQDGRLALPDLISSAGGRCRGAHFGPYDYTASLGIVAEHQSPAHPACDFARQTMLAALAGQNIQLSDGPTNLLPIPPHRGAEISDQQLEENRQAVHRAWKVHFEDVQRSLRNGFYQSWDLHPAQLPSRYAAVFAFYLQSLPQATARLRNFIDKSERATRVGAIFDDAATGLGLFSFFRRGFACGALTRAEAEIGIEAGETAMPNSPATG